MGMRDTDGGAEVYLGNYMTEQGEPTIQSSVFCVYYALPPQRQNCFQPSSNFFIS